MLYSSEMYTFKTLDSWEGAAHGSGQCVALVQLALGCPQTAKWKRGLKVRGADLQSGTAIATFAEDGKYANTTDGASHAAIYLWQDAEGIQVLDQWLGHPTTRRTIRFNAEKAANDGDQFYVIDLA